MLLNKLFGTESIVLINEHLPDFQVKNDVQIYHTQNIYSTNPNLYCPYIAKTQQSNESYKDDNITSQICPFHKRTQKDISVDLKISHRDLCAPSKNSVKSKIESFDIGPNISAQ